MTKPILILAALAAVLPLSACGDKQPATQAQAGGEILPGSINDEMLPMDTATSKPPLAPKTAGSGNEDGSGDGDDGEKAGDAAPAKGRARAEPAAAAEKDAPALGE
ncbi:MAG: hypothetical protein ACKOPO_01135 [Novosphingobium sp.]